MADGDDRPRWTAASAPQAVPAPAPGAAPPAPTPAGPMAPHEIPAAPLPFLERTIAAVAFATTLTIALANNPDWGHYIDLGTFLPQRYVDLLAVLPVSTNTAIALVLLHALTLGTLFLARDPVVPLGAITAITLGLATYPYGRIRWHRLFLDIGTTADAPGLAQWLSVLVPVLLLAALPLLLHVRRVRQRYLDKQVDPPELRHATRHLTRQAFVTGGLALATAALLGLVLRIGPVLAGASDIWKRNTPIVLVVVAILLLAALAVGAGIFRGPDDAPPASDAPPEKRDEDRHATRR